MRASCSNRWEKLFFGLEELNQKIVAIKSLHTGSLHISATSSYAMGLLPAIVGEFKARHPDILISLNIQSHEQVVDWVEAGRADIGLTSQAVANPGLDFQQLAKVPAICIFPAGHSLGQKEKLKPADLAGLPFVSFPRGSQLRFQIDRLFERSGIERTRLIQTTSHHAVCSLVAQGIGVSLVNPVAPRLAENGEIEARPLSPSVDVELGAIWNETSLSIVGRSFRDFLIERFEQEIDGKGGKPRRTPKKTTERPDSSGISSEPKAGKHEAG